MTVLANAYQTISYYNENAGTTYLLITSANSTALENCRIRANIASCTGITYSPITESYYRAFVDGDDGYRYIYNRYWLITAQDANSTITITLQAQETYGSGVLALITTTE